MTQPGMDDPPLTGLEVVVTGDGARVDDLDRRVAALGARVVRLPVSSIVDASDGGAALRIAAAALVEATYDWVVVTSANAVDRLGRALEDRGVPERVRWAAVGASTQRALLDSGLPCHLVPLRSTGDGLAAALTDTGISPGRLLYPRAEQVRTDLATRLRASGWDVDEVIAYRNQPADPDPAEVRAARDADGILLTSSSAAERIVTLLGVDRVPPIVVTIGPSTSTTVRHVGLQVAAEADSPTLEALVDALVVAAGRGEQRSDG